MSKSISERRLVENEAVFRKANEAAQKLVEKQNKRSKNKIDSVYFYCECSQGECRERICLPVETYRKMHQDRHQFLIKPGHELPKIERIKLRAKDYILVEKFVKPPENNLELTPSIV